ncbi:PLAT/LH2 domain-containing protein [Treponema sp.]|uniref:PLAT/LH2 domain-containing protein n=1 Tax=Treponema sp. TaxID=166 RepID=UPI00388FA6E2
MGRSKLEYEDLYYLIETKTKDGLTAGTDSNIYITLYGAKGVMENIFLNPFEENLDPSPFHRGKKERFIIAEKSSIVVSGSYFQDIGDVYKIRVTNEGNAINSDWDVESITITEARSDDGGKRPVGSTCVFNINREITKNNPYEGYVDISSLNIYSVYKYGEKYVYANDLIKVTKDSNENLDYTANCPRSTQNDILTASFGFKYKELANNRGSIDDFITLETNDTSNKFIKAEFTEDFLLFVSEKMEDSAVKKVFKTAPSSYLPVPIACIGTVKKPEEEGLEYYYQPACKCKTVTAYVIFGEYVFKLQDLIYKVESGNFIMQQNKEKRNTDATSIVTYTITIDAAVVVPSGVDITNLYYKINLEGEFGSLENYTIDLLEDNVIGNFKKSVYTINSNYDYGRILRIYIRESDNKKHNLLLDEIQVVRTYNGNTQDPYKYASEPSIFSNGSYQDAYLSLYIKDISNYYCCHEITETYVRSGVKESVKATDSGLLSYEDRMTFSQSADTIYKVAKLNEDFEKYVRKDKKLSDFDTLFSSATPVSLSLATRDYIRKLNTEPITYNCSFMKEVNLSGKTSVEVPEDDSKIYEYEAIYKQTFVSAYIICNDVVLKIDKAFIKAEFAGFELVETLDNAGIQVIGQPQQPPKGFEYRDNKCRFVLKDGVSLAIDEDKYFGYFYVKDFCITKGQDPEGRIYKGLKIPIDKDGNMIIECGRKSSTEVKEWFKEQFRQGYAETRSWVKAHDEYNFALKGSLFINLTGGRFFKNDVCKFHVNDVLIAQARNNYRNAWILSNARSSEISKVTLHYTKEDYDSPNITYMDFVTHDYKRKVNVRITNNYEPNTFIRAVYPVKSYSNINDFKLSFSMPEDIRSAYFVRMKTKNNIKAGSVANLFITMEGEYGKSEKMRLNGSKEMDGYINSGDYDLAVIGNARKMDALGRIFRITLENEKHVLPDSWDVDYITISHQLFMYPTGDTFREAKIGSCEVMSNPIKTEDIGTLFFVDQKIKNKKNLTIVARKEDWAKCYICCSIEQIPDPTLDWTVYLNDGESSKNTRRNRRVPGWSSDEFIKECRYSTEDFIGELFESSNYYRKLHAFSNLVKAEWVNKDYIDYVYTMNFDEINMAVRNCAYYYDKMPKNTTDYLNYDYADVNNLPGKDSTAGNMREYKVSYVNNRLHIFIVCNSLAMHFVQNWGTDIEKVTLMNGTDANCSADLAVAQQKIIDMERKAWSQRVVVNKDEVDENDVETTSFNIPNQIRITRNTTPTEEYTIPVPVIASYGTTEDFMSDAKVCTNSFLNNLLSDETANQILSNYSDLENPNNLNQNNVELMLSQEVDGKDFNTLLSEQNKESIVLKISFPKNSNTMTYTLKLFKLFRHVYVISNGIVFHTQYFYGYELRAYNNDVVVASSLRQVSEETVTKDYEEKCTQLERYKYKLEIQIGKLQKIKNEKKLTKKEQKELDELREEMEQVKKEISELQNRLVQE